MNETLDIYCIAAALDDVLSDMNLEQAALVLRLPIDADAQEIKSSYKRLVSLYHPDKPGGNAMKFKLVHKAKEVMLGNLETQKPIVKVVPQDPVGPHTKKPERGHPWGSWYDRDIGR